MKYALYNFDSHTVLDEHRVSTQALLATYPVGWSRKHCIVQRSTTDEDRKYLGDRWQCYHCIDPESCTSCNPKYEYATLRECASCECITWHLDDDCLHCEETRNEH